MSRVEIRIDGLDDLLADLRKLGDLSDELLVDFGLQRFQPRHIRVFFRLKRVKDHLVGAGGIDAAVNPQLFNSTVKTETC